MTEEIKEIKETKNEQKTDTGLMKTLLDEVAVLKQQNEMLIQVADRKALGNYYARHQKQLPKIVRLNLINGKVILSWLMTDNEVYKEAIGNTFMWKEKQTVTLNLEDKTILEMPYIEYTRKYTQVEAKVISRITDENTGELKIKVGRIDNGKEYEIEIRYIN